MGDHWYCGAVKAAVDFFGITFTSCEPELICPTGMRLVAGPAKLIDPENKTAPICFDETDVTQDAYFSYEKANGITSPDRPKIENKLAGGRKPMIYVSYEDAEAYCKAMGKRLPTFGEWAKAARGPQGCKYGSSACSSVTDGNDKPLANYWRDDNSPKAPTDVGGYPANANGLFDMAGNVSQWVSFEFPRGRVGICGGSWRDDGVFNMLAMRCIPFARNPLDDIGFRCAALPHKK